MAPGDPRDIKFGDCVACTGLAFDLALSPAENVRSCCNLSRDSRSIGAIALPGTGCSGGTSAGGAVAVRGVETLADDAELRALAARIAARRSIGVRSGGLGTVDGSIFSTLICVVDNWGCIKGGGAEAAWASDCDLMDDSWGVREGVGVKGLSFSVFTLKLFIRGGAEAGTEAGSGSLGRRPVVAGRRATLARGRPDDLRHEGTYSSSSFPSSESTEESTESLSFP